VIVTRKILILPPLLLSLILIIARRAIIITKILILPPLLLFLVLNKEPREWTRDNLKKVKPIH